MSDAYFWVAGWETFGRFGTSTGSTGGSGRTAGRSATTAGSTCGATTISPVAALLLTVSEAMQLAVSAAWASKAAHDGT